MHVKGVITNRSLPGCCPAGLGGDSGGGIYSIQAQRLQRQAHEARRLIDGVEAFLFFINLCAILQEFISFHLSKTFSSSRVVEV